ncbi:protein kinase domain-containing protein [Microcystis ichthyoblabe FBCC-A1114]|uniref:protein kinase domain-containing protein n=1 Tax=Microcystis ichthyoblabe TaxID=75561 RepID=UPI003D286A2F
MSLCLNPDCSHQNTPTDKFCHKCGSQLLLRERYRALKLIGQGGFGKTFQAIDEDKPSKPYCVIKQFFPSAQGTGTLQKAAELFKEEAIRLDSLGRYPQIPELYAYFTANDGRQYLVQEYIEGQNLEQELKQEGVFNEAKIKHLLSEILPILEFIHSKQVIHRDIKPENIIRRKSDNKLILVDFGAAKFVSHLNRSITGTIIGSAEYIAPEQGNGKAVNASDLYSLGITCLYLLTGISPFDLFDGGEHQWVWRQWLVNNPVSNELGNILDKLIEFGTKKRYQSASEVLQALQIKTSVSIPQTTITQTSPSIQLKSAKGIDYRNLEDLLKRQQWKEADIITFETMLRICNRHGFLRVEDIDIFPCEDLQIIDQLWLNYSQEKFGFSIQKQLFDQLNNGQQYNDKLWDDFGLIIGWRKDNKNIRYDRAIFDINAPRGHLPCRIFDLWNWGGVGGGTGSLFYSLAWRLAKCKI